MTGVSTRWLLRPLPLVLLLALSACAGGSAKYGCPGLPDKPMCLPPSAIYALTDGQGPPPASQRRPSTLKADAGVCVGCGEGSPGLADDRATTGLKP